MFKPPFHTSVKLNRKEEGFYCYHLLFIREMMWWLHGVLLCG